MIEFGYSVEDAYNFTLKSVTEKTTLENGMTSSKKSTKVVYKNPDIDCWSRVQRLDVKNAPAVLKNQEFFRATNPFYRVHDHFEPFGWTLETVLLAFQHGYIDGWLISTGNFFSYGPSVKGIIIVDPLQRLKVRDYFKTEFKNWLDNCKEEDFKYAVFTNARLGISNLYKSLKEAYDDISEDYPEAAKEALANLIYYDVDLINIWGQRTAKPLVFDIRPEADVFCVKYKGFHNAVESTDCKPYSFPVNDTLTDYIRSSIEKKE